ncbi:MAG: type 1 glutamine amidotransferase [Candidatus Magasanikbacteria bacterium]
MSEEKKVLVVQFRTDQSLNHEQDCFKDELLERNIKLSFINATEEDLDISLLAEIDGVILAGSGEFYLTKGHGEGTWKDEVFSYLDYILGADIPTLGVCLGSQIIALHQGGELTDDEHYHEVGAFEICLTDHCEKCKIFSNLDSGFDVTLAHQDTIIDLPNNVVRLAGSNRVDFQAFKIEDKQVWGTLFHPELTRARLKYRLELYPSYADNIDEALSDFGDTSYSTEVLHRFVDVVEES